MAGKNFTFITVLILIFASLHTTGISKSTIYVYPQNKLVCINQTFNIEIKIQPAEPIYSAICNISFNPNILQAISVSNGGMFDIWIDVVLKIDNSNGTISYIMAASNSSIINEGIFCIVKFRAVSTGTSPVNIETPYIGGKTYPYINSINGSVNVIVDTTPPVTTIQFSQPYYYDGNNWISSLTAIYLNATDEGIGVNATYYRVWNGSWTPWMEYTMPFNLAEEGIHYIEFYSIDAIGNDEEIKNESVYVDNSKPVITINYGIPYEENGREWISGRKIVYVNASDIIPFTINVTIYSFLNSSYSYYEGDNASFNLQHGKNWINITAWDALGNTAYLNKTLYCDSIPPQSVINPQPVLPDGENGWYISNVSIYINATDDGSGVNRTFYSIDGSDIIVYNESFVLSNGIHEIEYYSIDNIGNAEKLNAYSVKIDTIEPSVEIVKYPPSPTNKNNITFEWNGSDNLTPYSKLNFSYKLAGYEAEWHEWGNRRNTTYNEIPDGEYTFFVKVRDDAGNENCTSINFTIDTSPPEIKNIEAIPYVQKIGGYVNISCSVEGIEIEEVGISIKYPDGSLHNYSMENANETYYFNASYSMLGIYNFTIHATDSANNTGFGNGSFMISDLTPPYVNISYPVGREILKGNIVIRWNATDNHDKKEDLGITIKYSPDDGVTWRLVAQGIENKGSYIWNASNARDGNEYRIKVMAYDTSGNIGADVSGKFSIDNTPPSLEFKKPVEGYLYLFGRQILPVIGNRAIIIGKIGIEVDARDANGIEKVEFYVDGVKKYEKSKEPYSWEWNEYAIGNHEIKVVTFDRAGNKNEEKIGVTAFIL